METVPSLILEVTSFFYATGLVFICSKEPGDGLQQHQLARQNLLSSLLIRRKNLTFKIRSHVREITAEDTALSSGVICQHDLNSPELPYLLKNSSLGIFFPWFVMVNDDNAIAELGRNVAINRQIYFLNTATNTLYESYTVGTKLIQRELGTLEMSSSLDGDEEEEQTGEFHFSSDQNFYRRRSDFHGLPITMMVEKKAPFLFLDSKYKGEKTFQLDKTGDEVFDVTNFINGGIYPKILKIVQENLNFSLTALKRADGSWGSFKNGSWNGLIRTVLAGEADFIGCSITLREDRAEVLDYLLPIGRSFNGVFIKNDVGSQRVWDIFLKPFSRKLWILLGLITLGLTITIKLLEFGAQSNPDKIKKVESSTKERNSFKHEENSVPSVLGDWILTYWAVFMSYFAKPLINESWKKKTALRIFILFIALIGNVLFMSYRASLTSELSVIRTEIPFSDLDGLLESDYGLVIKGGGSTANSFLKAQDSLMERLYTKKMQPNPTKSFQSSLGAAIATIVQESNLALFYGISSVRNYKEYECDVLLVWQSPVPSYSSAAFPKGSPLTKFFNWSVLKIIEDGTLRLIEKRWTPRTPSCFEEGEGTAVTSLGYAKLCSLFAWLLMASIVALFIGMIEFIRGGNFLSQENTRVQQQKEDHREEEEADRLDKDLARWNQYISRAFHGNQRYQNSKGEISTGAIDEMLDILKKRKKLGFGKY